MDDKSAALVLFSGGQDSTVCVAWALDRYARVETLGFDYGQRHDAELAARKRILNRLPDLNTTWSNRLGDDHVLTLSEFATLSETALTRDSEIRMTATGLPNTFVPGRNLLFFVYAAAIAYRRGIDTLVGGMCETDFSGYPDCRATTLSTLAHAISLGIDRRMEIATPLMWIDKAGTWQLADNIAGQPFIELIIEETHTCYLGDRDHRHAWGYGCAACPACDLRAAGWTQWQNNTV